MWNLVGSCVGRRRLRGAAMIPFSDWWWIFVLLLHFLLFTTCCFYILHYVWGTGGKKIKNQQLKCRRWTRFAMNCFNFFECAELFVISGAGGLIKSLYCSGKRLQKGIINPGEVGDGAAAGSHISRNLKGGEKKNPRVSLTPGHKKTTAHGREFSHHDTKNSWLISNKNSRT